ncbi:50S ribosomal protein L37e [Candidatus Woesearchaeota archaeon]|nr:50S ribosomal protein L37e [Candidatus Woesearchaeota archaeon]
MVKGTPSKGKLSRSKTHIVCRRCGKRTYHKTRKICASCGYGKTAKLRNYNWSKKKPYR